MSLTGTDTDRRPIIGRWTITAALTMDTASQIGCHASDNADSTFARDSENAPILQGASLAGALRSALSDMRAGSRSEDHADAKRLFGFMERKAEKQWDGHESPLIVFDSFGKEVEATIRDGVMIDPKTRTAEPGHKYDRELALPGLVFPIRIDLIITETMDETAVLSDLCDALDALARGEIALGARKSRGLGRCSCTAFRAVRYDLKTVDGWTQYANSDSGAPAGNAETHCCARKAVGSISVPALHPPTDARKDVVLNFHLDICSSVLIRSPGIDADDPDNIHLRENHQSLLSGTSLAGVMRSHAGRIVKTLSMHDMNPLNICVAALFGPSPDDLRRKRAGPAASRVVVNEAVIVGGHRFHHTRTKIDRFTGAPVDTALFDETPVYGGNASFSVRYIPSPLADSAQADAELGLLLLVARDITQGLVPIGGESGVGRGVVRGTVKLKRHGDAKELDILADACELEPLIQTLTKGVAIP